ncbi:MAG: alpha/beta hydrolase [Rhodosalinus sp.]
MSLRLAAMNAALRAVAKPALARTGTPERARRDFERIAPLLRGPAHLREIRRPGPPPLGWLSAGPVPAGRAILWFHGGAYVAGSLRTHRGMLGRLSRLARTEVCAPEYRLAPEAPFPAAFEDACAAWGLLRAQGLAPGDIVLGGDSAGGGLALALLSRLLEEGERPRAAVLFSPWVDLTLSGASLRENARADPLLPVERIEELVDIVAPEADRRDPRLSPLFAPFRAPPPVLIQASRTEILRDDARRMATRLRAADGRVHLDLWPDTPHVWQILDGWVPEARAALARAGDFVQTAFAETMR